MTTTPNPAALLARQSLATADGAYLERAEVRELAVETWLRACLTRVPTGRLALRRARRFARLVTAREPHFQAMSDDALRERVRQSSRSLRGDGLGGPALVEVFAGVREASRRITGMKHHEVQLMGGWTILQGAIAEMQTGEGKTLVATLAATAAALSGAGVHVVTVNDYLAERDADSNRALFEYFGLSVGIIREGMTPEERAAVYASSIVYVSNKEIVFDYLKDQIALQGATGAQLHLRRLAGDRGASMLLRGLHLAIIDEADSVLIDEARTPLIISESVPATEAGSLWQDAIGLARQLERDRDFTIDAHRTVRLTEAGRTAIEDLSTSLKGRWRSARWRDEYAVKALTALWCYERDVHYILDAESKVQIVDESSGRVMADRSWEDGLHQMVEAKEGAKPSDGRRTLAKLTYQRFFRRYLVLGGMSGTVREVRAELKRVYELDVIAIPTHAPSRRQRWPSRGFPTQAARWVAVADEATRLQQAGRAVLIGTRSVAASEALGDVLAARGLAHQVLNARQDAEEARIVEGAGQRGVITIATNMAGRGTDIKPAPEVLATGGLHVILTEFHDTPRVDRQLFGRAARQGQPGSGQAMVSLEDEIFGRYAPWLSTRLARWCGTEIASSVIDRLARAAQRRAERHDARIRADTLRQDRDARDRLGFAGWRR